jgi:hypothetical protein
MPCAPSLAHASSHAAFFLPLPHAPSQLPARRLTVVRAARQPCSARRWAWTCCTRCAHLRCRAASRPASLPPPRAFACPTASVACRNAAASETAHSVLPLLAGTPRRSAQAAQSTRLPLGRRAVRQGRRSGTAGGCRGPTTAVARCRGRTIGGLLAGHAVAVCVWMWRAWWRGCPACGSRCARHAGAFVRLALWPYMRAPAKPSDITGSVHDRSVERVHADRVAPDGSLRRAYATFMTSERMYVIWYFTDDR